MPRFLTPRIRITRPGVYAFKDPLDDADLLDISDDVENYQWRYGTRWPNAMGHVAIPGSGQFILDNHEDKYWLFNHDAAFDADAGARIHADLIDPDTGTEYIGWRGWTTDLSTPEQSAHIAQKATLAAQGALGQVGGRYNELFTFIGTSRFGGSIPLVGTVLDAFLQLFANAPTHTVVTEIFKAIDWPAAWTQVGTGRSRFDLSRLNLSGTVGNVRQFTSTLDALAVVAQAEVGRIYDNHLGQAVFEGRLDRAYSSQVVPVTIDGDQCITVRQIGIKDSIINEISAHGAEYSAGAKAQLADSDYRDDQEPPIKVTFEPNEIKYVPIALNSGRTTFAYVRDVDVNWTSTRPTSEHQVAAHPAGDGNVAVFVQHEGAEGGTLTINSIEARKYRLNTDFLGFLINQLNAESVFRYGRRRVRYPVGIVRVPTEDVTSPLVLQNVLNWILNSHNAVSNDPRLLHRCDIRVSANDYPQFLNLRVGSLINLRNALGIGSGGERFFVDEVEHQGNDSGEHQITLKCSASAIWAMLIAGVTRFGVEGRPGF